MKDRVKKSAIRAARTFVQGIIGYIPTTSVMIQEFDEKTVFIGCIAALGTAVVSFLTGIIGGLPEEESEE